MTNYREAGVDIDAGEELVQRIAPLVRTTFRKEVLSDLGGFGGLFRFPSDQYQDPVLVSGTDGVGTKLRLAVLMDRHDTIGIDLVAMCVNDVVVTGAEPLFFLDYFATGKLDVSKAEAIIGGIAKGCRDVGCALIGGETAEMPSCYPDGEYDLAGFAVGVVERAKIINGSQVRAGDVLVGLPSTGLHSNGFSLARQVLLDGGAWKADSQLPELTRTLGETLLEPTKIYARHVRAFVSAYSLRGIAHITGGGITGNLPRILSANCQALVQRGSWPVPPIFQVIQKNGNIEDDEMYRVFNMGIGMVFVVPPGEVDGLIGKAREIGDDAHVIGEIRDRAEGQPPLRYVEATGS